MSNSVLSVTNLSKTFYHRPILTDLNLSVDRGEIMALMGRNGVGKSTFLRVLARVSAPTRGGIEFHGRSILQSNPETRTGLLYLGHAPGLYPALTAVENLSIMTGLYGYPAGRPDILQVLQRVGLTAQAYDPIKIYSQGMLQRIKLALALLIDWDLLLFDEPFAGLDAQGKALTEAVLQEWKTRGKTMLLVVHDFEWIWNYCTRLVILEAGSIGVDIPINPDSRDQGTALFREMVG
ncbi:MAG: ABC transporter ATP-binding protein [Candidatus Neomarinimicrobiota bacterium]